MKRRLFIAISLPETALHEIDIELPTLEHRFLGAARFIPRENWHMTLIFFGDQEEDNIPKIHAAMDAALLGFAHDSLLLGDITYGPQHHAPRMIWLNASKKTSIYLDTMKESLRKELNVRGIHWNDDGREFHGHITLARFNERSKETELPLLIPGGGVCKEFTVDLFSSTLTPEGSQYSLLYSVARS